MKNLVEFFFANDCSETHLFRTSQEARNWCAAKNNRVFEELHRLNGASVKGISIDSALTGVLEKPHVLSYIGRKAAGTTTRQEWDGAAGLDQIPWG